LSVINVGISIHIRNTFTFWRFTAHGIFVNIVIKRTAALLITAIWLARWVVIFIDMLRLYYTLFKSVGTFIMIGMVFNISVLIG